MNTPKDQKEPTNFLLTEEDMKKLIQIARKGYHETWCDNTQWHFDNDKESDVIKEYFNSK